MVNYINQPKKSHWKRNLAVTALVLAIAGGTTIGVLNRKKPIEERIAEPTKVELSIDNIVDEMQSSSEFTNEIVRLGIDYLNENSAIETQTYTQIFEIIKNKAEEKPELMDYFGENAQRYMEKKITDKYIGTIEDSFRDASEFIEDKGRPVIDALRSAKDYIMDKLEGE